MIEYIVEQEGLRVLGLFRRLHTSAIDTIFTGMAQAGIPCTVIQQCLLKDLHHYVRRMTQLGNPINPMAITVDLLEAETNYIEESKATTTSSKPRLALPDKFKDHNKWRAFRDMFTNYLYSIREARNVPLSYVIRSNALP
jgi:hypothetical protein